MRKDSALHLTVTLVLGLALSLDGLRRRIHSGAGRRARDSPARRGPLRDLKAQRGFTPRSADRRAIYCQYRAVHRGPDRSVCSRAVVKPAMV